jgi:hypothetical protein
MKTIKVLAGSLAAITVGATLALGIFAAPITSLGDYVKVSGSALNSPVIVIGDGATAGSGFAQDVVGAADIAAAVAGYATTSVSTGAVGMGVSGGAEIGTTNTKLFYGDALSKTGVKSTLTKTELPTLLASGKLTDISGTDYLYDQYLTLQSGNTISYSTSGGDLTDPDLVLSISEITSGGVVNYIVTFNKLLNVSSSTHNKKLKLMGIDYTIGSTSAYDTSTKKLVLYGSSLVQTMSGGEEKKITVDNVEYTVKVLGASGATTAAISVNGESQSIAKGTSYLISGLAVYAEDVFWLSSTDQAQNSVKLSFGTNKITLEDGVQVKKGTSDTTVDGSLVTLTGSATTSTANNGISMIQIAMAAKDSSKDYIKQGAENAWVDPVFGAFKLALGGLSGGSTEKITIDNSGTTGANLKFTDYRGNEKTLQWAFTGTTGFTASLNATSTQQYVVVENQTVRKNDYVLLAPSQESDYGHIMQYITSSSIGSSGAYIELKDVMADSTSRFYLTNSSLNYQAGTFYIDGQTYYAALNSGSTNSTASMSFSWGAGAEANKPGSKITVFPLVKTSRGGYLTLVNGNLTSITTTVATAGVNATFELPGGDLTLSLQGPMFTDCSSRNESTGGTGSTVVGTCTLGRLTYNVTASNVTNITKIAITDGAGTVYKYPSVLFYEENAKNTATPASEVQDAVITTVNAGTGTTQAMTVAQSVITTATKSDFTPLQSDSSVSMAINRRGTMVKYDSDSQGLVEITYPDEQSVATVAVGDSPVFGAGAAGTVQQAIKITSPIGKLASEVVNNPAPGADLILVGGPCANSLVAKLLASSNVTCDSWNYTTGIIKEVTGGFTDGSRALIVAGTLAKDTRDLAKMLIQGTLTYAV